MKKSEVKFVLKSFFLWKVFTFIPILIAPFLFETQKNFLGGGLASFLSNPFLWSWANFDGEHYLSIAKMGYLGGEQAFFPLYPLLIRLLGNNVLSGILISNILFVIALFGLYKLVKLDFSEKISRTSILLVLLFPTSFYFGAVYTESLFLFLTVWSFYFFRKENYLLSTFLGIFASATRVVGIALLPAYYLFSFLKEKRIFIKGIVTSFIPLGIFSYMYYSFKTWGDFFKFFNVASGFGEQRSDHIILLPQVFYRYFVKIIPNISWDYFPVVFTTLLEISVALYFLYLIVVGLKKINVDYWIYLLLIYLIPTLSGSFSSLPRYVVVAFPAFILMALSIEKANKYMRIGIYIIMAIIAVVAQALFTSGYFVS